MIWIYEKTLTTITYKINRLVKSLLTKILADFLSVFCLLNLVLKYKHRNNLPTSEEKSVTKITAEFYNSVSLVKSEIKWN